MRTCDWVNVDPWRHGNPDYDPRYGADGRMTPASPEQFCSQRADFYVARDGDTDLPLCAEHLFAYLRIHGGPQKVDVA